MRASLSAVSRWLSWHRRPVAAIAAAVAVLAITVSLRPPEPPQTAVAVLVAERPGGHRLVAADLRLVDWPLGVLPEATVADPAVLEGRTLAAPMSAGSPVTELSVISEQSAAAAPGMVIAPVRLDDTDLVSLLRPGERIDLLGIGSDGTTTVIAEAVRLVSVPAPEGTSGGFGPAGQEASLILVEVTVETAVALTAATNTGPVSAVLR